MEEHEKHINIERLKRTKMVCTIGPATSSYEALEKLIHIGMNAARLNFSHGTHDEFKETIGFIRELSKKHSKPVAIIQDLQGPKIRIGILEKNILIEEGDSYYLGTAPDTAYPVIPVDYNFVPYLHQGHTVFFNDAYLRAHVAQVGSDYAVVRFTNKGLLQSHKGINIPDTHIPNAALTEKDLDDLAFGLEMDVDYIALSLVQTKEDILQARNIINARNPEIKIIAKVETKSAIRNIDEIIDVSDVIMIARGDLAVEIGLENVPIAQTDIIRKCKEKRRVSIVATQMLESMIIQPRPTRAEVNDVASATYAEADAVMLSGESAVGSYPFNATEVMRSIIKTTENHIAEFIGKDTTFEIRRGSDNYEAIASAVTLLANRMHCDLVAVATESGKSAIALASLRPHRPVMAITQSEKAYNQLALVWGIRVFKIHTQVKTIDALIEETIRLLSGVHYLTHGDRIIFMTGLHVGVAGETNSLRIVSY